MVIHRRLPGIAAALILSASIALAQSPEQLMDLTATGARVFSAARGQTLTAAAPSASAAVEIFLRAQNRPQSTINSLALVSENTNRAGLTHLQFRQVVNGLEVYGAYVKATVNARRELVHLAAVLPDPPVQVAGSTVSALAALQAAAGSLYPGRSFNFRETGQNGNTTEFSSGDGFFFRNPTVTRVALPLVGGVMSQGWLVETWTGTDNQLHHTVVGSGGRVLQSELRTASERYNVFTEHPPIAFNGGPLIGGGQAILEGPVSTIESPYGWVSTHGKTGGTQSEYRLSGNNGYAYLDRDNNNSPDPAGAQITNGEFTATADLTADPTTAVNQRVAIQNLFWANNIIHDKLYTHGFNEAAANFQENNFGRGGVGNDSVLAEAQDGGGTNNANFATPSEGSSPRMQMYIWTQSMPNRDGDVDTDIVYHEYGHGLTWRMIGSMSGCMSGAIGEGASDTLSIWMNNDDVVAEYSYNNVNGIRRYPYTNYPLSYNDLSGSSVHANGELFAAIMWRAREYFQQNNISLDHLWTYFVDGMNYIPAGPRYEDMRNGIVQSAVNHNLGHQCRIWQAFADFGVGVGASGSCSVRGIFATWNVTESFAVPSECTSGNTAPSVSVESPADGATVSGIVAISINASDAQDAAGTLNVQWSVDGGAWQPATYNSSTGRYQASWDTTSVSNAGHTVNARATDSGSLTGTDSNSVTVSNGTTNNPPTATLVSPAQGATVSGTVTIQISATDTDGTVNSVQWSLDNTGVWSGAVFNSGTGYWEAGWDTTGVSNGSHTVHARATDDDGATSAVDSHGVTVDNPTSSSGMHVGDLDGASTNNGNTWTANVTITIHDNNHNLVSNATVSGSWSNGASGNTSCITNGGGACTVSVGGIPKRNSSVTFTVSGVSHGSLTYASTGNHDPDGDSNGTSITVSKP